LFAVAGQKLSRNTVFALGALLIWTTAIAAEPPAETGNLRVSHTLAPRQAPDESERALLRLEARVGRTLHDDRALISDLLTRINRMTVVVADIHKLITDMPVGKPCKQVSTPCPTTASTPTAPATPAIPPAPTTAPTTALTSAGSEFSDWTDLPWPAIIGGASILGLLVLWLSRRRRAGADAEVNAVNVVSVPGNGTLTKPPPKAVPRPQANGVMPTQPSATATKPAPTAPPPAKPEQAPSPKIASIRPRPAQPAEAFSPTAAKRVADAKPEGESDMSLELAEVMLSMGLTDGAAQTLSDHIQHNPRQALFHWLKLLDVYRQSGMKAEFEKAAAELQEHFNMAPPEWMETQQAAGTKKVEKLEDYPHIAGRVQELWPHRTCAEYLNRLLEDTRGGTRAGFPKPVVEEILLLLSLVKD
jgi:hypothetical protein